MVSLYVYNHIRIFSACVCARMLPKGKKNIKLSNQGATDRAFGTTAAPNECVGCTVAEPSWNGIQLSAGQANLPTLHPSHPHSLGLQGLWLVQEVIVQTGNTKNPNLKCKDSRLAKVTPQSTRLQVCPKDQWKGSYDSKKEQINVEVDKTKRHIYRAIMR